MGRYGGKEFILILPGACGESARCTADRLQELVIAEGMSHAHSRVTDIITVSQGLVTVEPDSELSPEDLVQQADTALYNAKHLGRNRICVA